MTERGLCSDLDRFGVSQIWLRVSGTTPAWQFASSVDFSKNFGLRGEDFLAENLRQIMVKGINVVQSIASSEVCIYRIELSLHKGRCFAPWAIWKVSPRRFDEF